MGLEKDKVLLELTKFLYVAQDNPQNCVKQSTVL